ncbi:MAG TPA: Fur family transcriptional regulator [Polyangiaceae bacterium]|nr:Fur family transcriptional regulator [Polyangiaceae bacterium]
MKVTGAELEQRIDRFKKACHAAGVKLTHQRLEIFREVAESTSHPDAEAVFRGVKRRVPSVSLDTVYRTLGLLTDLGILFTLGPRRESMRFDANLSPHHHYVCTSCGLTRDFEAAGFDSLSPPPGIDTFGSVSATHVELRGVCADCLAKEASGRQPS